MNNPLDGLIREPQGDLMTRVAKLEEATAFHAQWLGSLQRETAPAKLLQLGRDGAVAELDGRFPEYQKVVRDLVNLFRVLIDAGVITQEAANAAIQP